MSTYTIDTATSRATPSPAPGKRLTAPALLARKGKEPIVMLTAYTMRMAQLLDPHCDLLLVGDIPSARSSTACPRPFPVSLEMMCAHGAAVVRGSWHAMVAIDMPFGSYEESPEQAFRSAARVLKETNAAAVKLEGGEAMAETVAFLAKRGIPVIGHVGLTPQAVNALGGYRARGRDEAEADKMLADARAVAEAGCFALVIEGVMEEVAAAATKAVACPTIGIGASVSCDGQMLVTEDMLGLFERTPRFVKRFGDLASEISAAAAAYAQDVRSRAFPTDEQIYRGK
jgi:3-methyl-2-oxobutanoate hydroxymethyltransferase